METPSPVLLYKPQEIVDSNFPYLAKDTFLLVLMTEFQASLFETYSSKMVCVDSTHKTNQYRFKLITVVVADEYHNGCLKAGVYHIIISCQTDQPVAWAISDKEDAATLEAVWNVIHARCPNATVSTLMTDDSN